MKRIFGAVLAAILLLSTLPASPSSAASTDNFRITRFDIKYALSRDSEGRSVLRATETITAVFPQSDQNHGLERSIPREHNGHPTSLKIQEAKNVNGNDQYSTDTEGKQTIVRIGDPDAYVHGEQTYSLIYEQRDVTRFYNDTGRDEWYWDTNGTDWRVPIDTLTVSITIDPSIVSAQRGEPSCYVGRSGSKDTCQLAPLSVAGEYSVVRTNLQKRENVTVAFGFEEGTFKPYERSWLETAFIVWGTLQLIAIPIAIAILIIAAVFYYRMRNRSSETHSLVTEYIPPKDASVLVSSQIAGVTYGLVFSAQLIDLAVRRYISIVQTREKTMWKSAKYDILIKKDLTPLREEEKEIITDMFGHLPAVDERLALSKLENSTAYGKRTLDNDKKLKRLIDTTYALRDVSPVKSKVFYRWAKIMGVIAVLLLSIPLAITALSLWGFGKVLRPLTDKGLALRRYLLGLNKYIKASETERLAFLQGPDTAEKVGFAVNADDPSQVVKLYERVLPYAILFGHEKEWAKRLGEYYGQTQSAPEWYAGTSSFNAALFASSISSFSQSTLSSSGYSSSSGGSSGGGSSGGGGGGGGGGGW